MKGTLKWETEAIVPPQFERKLNKSEAIVPPQCKPDSKELIVVDKEKLTLTVVHRAKLTLTVDGTTGEHVSAVTLRLDQMHDRIFVKDILKDIKITDNKVKGHLFSGEFILQMDDTIYSQLDKTNYQKELKAEVSVSGSSNLQITNTKNLIVRNIHLVCAPITKEPKYGNNGNNGCQKVAEEIENVVGTDPHTLVKCKYYKDKEELFYIMKNTSYCVLWSHGNSRCLGCKKKYEYEKGKGRKGCFCPEDAKIKNITKCEGCGSIISIEGTNNRWVKIGKTQIELKPHPIPNHCPVTQREATHYAKRVCDNCGTEYREGLWKLCTCRAGGESGIFIQEEEYLWRSDLNNPKNWGKMATPHYLLLMEICTGFFDSVHTHEAWHDATLVNAVKGNNRKLTVIAYRDPIDTTANRIIILYTALKSEGYNPNRIHTAIEKHIMFANKNISFMESGEKCGVEIDPKITPW